MKIYYNRDLINKIKNKSNILAVVLVKYDGPIQITSSGDFRICCMLHNDHKPSLILYPSDNTFRCLSTKCRKYGDVIKLTQKIYNMDFLETIQTLAYAFNVKLPKTNDENVNYVLSKEFKMAKKSLQYQALMNKRLQKIKKK